MAWCPLYEALLGGYRYYRLTVRRRYEPSQFCSCGRDVEIGAGTLITCPAKMKIGHDVFIGENCAIGSGGGLQLGSFCALASYVTIFTLDHRYRGAESIPWGEAKVIKPVVIGDYVWVGRSACILPGVTVGEGAVIGLGAVVAKDVPPCAVVVGNPAQIVKYRDQDEYEALKKAGAIRSPNTRCKRLWIPEEMQRKYRELLEQVGYDVNARKEYLDLDD